MANVIDALLITLGLDASGFKKGSKETQEALKKTRQEADRHTKEMEERAKVTAAAFGKIKTEILGMLTAALGAGGVAQFVAKITEGDAATGRLAANLGLATKNLSAWEGVAGKFGSSAADIDSAFRNVFSIAQGIKMGQGIPASLAFLFSKSGLDTSEFVKLAQSGRIEDMMKMLQKAVELAPDKGLASNLLQQAGFSEQTFNFMREINDQLEKRLELQKQNNAASEEDAQIAKHRKQAWSELSDAFIDAGRRLINFRFTWAEMFGISNQINAWKQFGHLVANLFSTGEGGTRAGGSWDDASSANLPRGIRNNNPGNLNFAGQTGASLEDGPNARFAKFQTMAQGIAALASQLQRYAAQGVDTVASIISKYAPPNENNTGAYIKTVSKRLGVNPGDHLNLQNIEQLRLMIAAISDMEVGVGRINADQINAGLGLNRARAGNSTEVHIDQVTINTQATDAKGIARDFAGGVRDSYAFAAHASVGAQ
jgi:hypothetical protein